MERIKKQKNRVLIIIISIILVTIASVTLSQAVKLKTGAQYSYYYSTLKAGDIADESIVSSASFDVIDFEKTDLAKTEAVSKVLPRFTVSMESSYKMLDEFEKIKKEGTYSEKVYNYAYEILYKLINQGYFDFTDSSKIVGDGFTEVSITNSGEVVSLSDVVTKSNISLWVYQQLSKYRDDLSEDGISNVQKIVLSCATENVRYNEYETVKATLGTEEAVENITRTIEKGQVLIEKDHVISDEQLELLLLISSQEKLSFNEVLGQLLFYIICFSMEFIAYAFLMKKDEEHFVLYSVSLTLSVIVSLAATFFTISFFSIVESNFLGIYLPVIFAPVFMTMMTGKKKIGFIASFLFGTGVCLLPGAGIRTLFFCLVSGCVCVYTVRFVNKRTDSILQWIVSVLIVSVLYILFTVSAYAKFEEIGIQIIVLSAITFASIVLINIILPICEKLMNLPTVYRLYELASGDSKLLKKLSAAAPGTFNHSCQVSELAQAAALQVGADSLLAKVGGMYHDIGKTDHPEYFVENQSGENKHEDLNPSLSASIIKSHVKVGAEKGREAGLPKEIVDIIFQHHGNDVISFFYHEAVKDNDEDDGEVEKADYSYNATIPSTRECAIVMLADSVEAAARTIQNPTAAQFEKLINQIVNTKIEHGQLKACNLTMKDLDIISQSFLKSLSAMYHSRIEYPDEEDD